MPDAIVVTFVEADGSVSSGSVQEGQSLMQAALSLGVTGVWAECGGLCACATCHCYVDPDWAEAVGPPGELETAMLEAAFEPAPNSRLSCQIPVRPELSGITLRVPSQQA